MIVCFCKHHTKKNMRTLIKRCIIFLVVITVTFSGSMPTTEASAASKNVAKLTIFSDGSGEFYGTHAFLHLKNTSSKSITVLGNKLSPNEAMTIGTYRNVDGNGRGIYINLEAAFIAYQDAYDSRVSLTTDLTKAELDEVIDEMKSRNKWSYT